jgi:hypothetical protein
LVGDFRIIADYFLALPVGASSAFYITGAMPAGDAERTSNAYPSMPAFGIRRGIDQIFLQTPLCEHGP